MKRIIIALIVFMGMTSHKALAYDIAVENEDGITIYYNYINEGKELEVTYKEAETEYSSLKTGYEDVKMLRIPETVYFSGRKRKVTAIGSSAFAGGYQLKKWGCQWLTIYVPKSINTIKEKAFSYHHRIQGNSSSVKKVIVEDIDAWLNIKIEGPISNVEEGDNCGYTDGYSLWEDENTEIKSIVIPNNLTCIDSFKFQWCRVESVIIPQTVKSIGEYAFACSSINTITIPSSVTTIGKNAFQGCWFSSITIPSSIAAISDGTFKGCTKLLSVTIPSSVRIIGAKAFSGCSSLNSITIPSSVTKISNGAFSDCTGLNSVELHPGLNVIGSYAFRGCSGLKSVTIPSGVTTVDSYAFKDCIGITSVFIPNSITTLGWQAFYFTNEAGNLVEFYSLIEEPADIYENVFSENLYKNASLYVPIGTIDKYKARKGWKNFVWIEEVVPSEIEDTKIDVEKKECALYSIDGFPLKSLQSGINIIKMSDGSTKKVLVK